MLTELFHRSKKAAKKRTLADAERDIQRLLAKIAVVEQEREFWTEQARNLQNHLQVVMRGQASMLEQMSRTSMTADDVKACVAQVSSELRVPLTSVEATKALVSSVREGTQGNYTLTRSKVREIAEEIRRG